MVRKILAALILLAMLSTLNAMPRPIIGIIGQQHLTWKKCRDSIPLLTVQADMPIPGQNETVTISGKVPDKSAQYKWSFSYINLEGSPITPSYKGAPVPLSPDSTSFTVTGTAKVSDVVAEYDQYNFVVKVRREADEENDRPKLVACATALVEQSIG